MTDKQRLYIKHLLNQIDLTNQKHRKSFIRVLANNEHRDINLIPDEMASSIIWKLEFITAKEHNGQLH